MSFGSDMKEELCQIPLEQLPCPHCLQAESLGVLLYCSTFSYTNIRINTPSEPFAQRLPSLFQLAFGVTLNPLVTSTQKKSFVIDDPVSLKKIYEQLEYDPEAVSCHIQFALLEEPCCRLSFCRGAFLAGGSVTNPEKQYHLELVTCHSAVNRELPALLHESDFAPKTSQRKGHFICYFKQSIHIQQFMSAIGAPLSAQKVGEAKTQKLLTRSVNRQVNCDAANLEKAVDAAQSQIKSIRFLESQQLLEDLPEKLKETAKLRLENPHCTLTELADFFSPPLSKSALNHRLRKLMALAQQHQSQALPSE